MTYIKWKDEVESYLVSLPQEEKQKIFSYFSEMYADKRDAGKSEEQIISEFGAPYDVAKKILTESRDAATAQGAQQVGKELPERDAPPGQAQSDPFAKGIPMPPPEQKKKKGALRIILSIILTVVLVGLTITLIGPALAVILEGFISIGYTAGALAAAKCGGGEGAAAIGLGLIISGVGCMLLAPFNALCGFLWRKLNESIKGA